MTVVVHMCRGNEGVAGLAPAATSRSPSASSAGSRSMAICSSTTPRAPATSRRCASCPRTPLPSSASSAPRLPSSNPRTRSSAGSTRPPASSISTAWAFARSAVSPSLYRYDRMGLDLQERKLELLVYHGPRDLGLSDARTRRCIAQLLRLQSAREGTSQGARECRTAMPRAAARRSSSRASTTSTARRAAGRCWRWRMFRSRCARASSWRCSGPSGCGKSTLLYLIGGFLPIETGHASCSTASRSPARARPRHRVPAFRAVSLEDGARQRALRPGEDGPAARGAREARAELHRSRRPHRLRGQLPLAALRRHEAAHRASPARSPSTRRSC